MLSLEQLWYSCVHGGNSGHIASGVLVNTLQWDMHRSWSTLVKLKLNSLAFLTVLLLACQ